MKFQIWIEELDLGSSRWTETASVLSVKFPSFFLKVLKNLSAVMFTWISSSRVWTPAMTRRYLVSQIWVTFTLPYITNKIKNNTTRERWILTPVSWLVAKLYTWSSSQMQHDGCWLYYFFFTLGRLLINLHRVRIFQALTSTVSDFGHIYTSRSPLTFYSGSLTLCQLHKKVSKMIDNVFVVTSLLAFVFLSDKFCPSLVFYPQDVV